MTLAQLHALAHSCPYDFEGMIQAMADDEGLLAMGGDLLPATLVSAYLAGAFPWYDHEPICWWSPDPRCVIVPSAFRASKSLRRTAKKQPWTLTTNHAFGEVIHACTQARTYSNSTWINDDIKQAYHILHTMGVAVSVEVWAGVPCRSELVGGLYGLQIGGVFCGESMFHRATDASKIAFWGLMVLACRHGIGLVDCQLENPHLMSLGAQLMTRTDFLPRYRQLTQLDAADLGARSEQFAVKTLLDAPARLW